MKKFSIYILLSFLGLILTSGPVFSQKGTGEDIGLAKRRLDLPVVTIGGNLLEIKTGPCEKTTGRSPSGTHLILDSDNETLNIHLGPSNAVDHVVSQLAVGSSLRLDVFRTDRLPANAYIAKSLILEDKTVHLRDDNFRPSWAYGGGGMRKSRNPMKGKRGLGPCW